MIWGYPYFWKHPYAESIPKNGCWELLSVCMCIRVYGCDVYIFMYIHIYIYIWRITIYFFNGNILSLKIAPNCSWNPGFTQALFICKISMKTFKNSFENKSRKNRTSEGARLAPGTAPAGVLDSTLAIESWRGRCKLVSLQIPEAF